MPETIQDTEHTMINNIKHDPHPSGTYSPAGETKIIKYRYTIVPLIHGFTFHGFRYPWLTVVRKHQM